MNQYVRVSIDLRLSVSVVTSVLVIYDPSAACTRLKGCGYEWSHPRVAHVHHCIMAVALSTSDFLPSERTLVLRRILFAAKFLPNELPSFWTIVASFASKGLQKCVSPESARLAMENLTVLNPACFSTDMELTKELIMMEFGATGQPLGVPLISDNKVCLQCGGNLILRGDRPSRLSLYTDTFGTVPALHYHKYCSNYRNKCNFVQYYGYYHSGDIVMYNDNWMEHRYFLSSQETGFKMVLLKRFDVELLIGQVSYKQKADIYNLVNCYDNTKKECSTVKKEKLARKVPMHGLV